MRTDKAWIAYHDLPQYAQTAALLAPWCASIYISCQPDQAPAFDRPTLPDAYPDQGPLGGIVTAMAAFPDHALWVLACDLPLLDAATLHLLATAPATPQGVTVLQSPDGHLEPLCSRWPTSCFAAVKAAFAQGQRSVQRVIRSLPYHAVTTQKPLFNANTPQEKAIAFRRMADQRNTPKNNS